MVHEVTEPAPLEKRNPPTIGVVIGLLQAATQVNEPSIAFIGKILALAAVLAIGGNWMLTSLLTFTTQLFQRIPSILG